MWRTPISMTAYLEGTKMTGFRWKSMTRWMFLMISGIVAMSASAQTAPASDPAQAAPPATAAPATQDSRDLKPIQTKQSAAVTIPQELCIGGGNLGI
jgi:hypothetical protein